MKIKQRVTDEMKKKWDDRIKFCQKHVELLNEWEYDFALSLEEHRYFGRTLTPRQTSKLNDIYNKVDGLLG